MTRARWRVSLAVAVAVTIAGAGCGSGKDNKPVTATKVTPEASNRSARTGGYLVLPSAEPRVLNPVLQNTFDLANPLIFEGLVGLDAKGELVPRLAESWELSPDGKTVTFRLRKGVQWHDGKAFTADDVLFTIDRIRSQRTLWSGYLAPVDKVEAPDAQTVKVTLAKPYGPVLAAFTFGVVSRHRFDGGDFVKLSADNQPIGTGPFRFNRWTPGKSIVLDANQGYWGERPQVDQVELMFEKAIAPSAYLQALRDRKLDLAPIRETADWSGVLTTPEFLERFEIGVVDEPAFVLIAWNGQRKLFEDKRVRVAMTHALDRQRVIEDVLKGAARPLSGPFYPSMWGGDPTVPPWPHDAARAAALLDEAGHTAKNGKRFPLELLITENSRGPVLDEMLAIFRRDLEEIGVQLNVIYVARNEMVDRLILRNFDAALYEWGVDLPDPDPYALLHSSEINGGGNYAGYSNPKIDELLEAGRLAGDRDKRREVYSQLHRLMHEDEPYTFLYAPQIHYAWSRRLHGVNPVDVGPLPRTPGLNRWWVDP
jgi:peptide/nickel transport system substrate-binding protein